VPVGYYLKGNAIAISAKIFPTLDPKLLTWKELVSSSSERASHGQQTLASGFKRLLNVGVRMCG